MSPNMHDNQTGITFEPLEVPAQFLLPQEAAVSVVSNDTLSLYGGIAAAGTIAGAMQIYYSQLPGIQARLHSWGDISGNVRYYKSVEVDLAAVAVGAWTDTLITTTENQLHANKDYAVLGYQCSEAVDVVGVKGSATGNLRVCGPGASSTLDITEYFVFMSEMQRTPYIPVFNSDDRQAFYVSAFNHAAIAWRRGPRVPDPGGADHAGSPVDERPGGAEHVADGPADAGGGWVSGGLAAAGVPVAAAGRGFVGADGGRRVL